MVAFCVTVCVSVGVEAAGAWCGVAEEHCWQLTENLGQTELGWRCLITAKHRGRQSLANRAAFNTNLKAKGRPGYITLKHKPEPIICVMKVSKGQAHQPP